MSNISILGAGFIGQMHALNIVNHPEFNLKYNLDISELLLSGINVSHPGIANLVEDRLKIKTSILRALTSKNIRDIKANQSIC